MKVSTSALALLQVIAFTAMVSTGLEGWEIALLMGTAQIVTIGVTSLAVLLGAMDNPLMGARFNEIAPDIKVASYPGATLAYAVCVAASTGWTGLAVCGTLTAASAGAWWMARKQM